VGDRSLRRARLLGAYLAHGASADAATVGELGGLAWVHLLGLMLLLLAALLATDVFKLVLAVAGPCRLARNWIRPRDSS